jgi:hypothetical protein
LVPGVTRRFAITWDYRCPYARIAHDHVVAGLRAGADWDVRFLAFSLSQSHVEAGMPDVWDAPHTDSGLAALQLAVAVRDTQPQRFLDTHWALFEHRHRHAGSLVDTTVLGKVLVDAGVDVEAAFDEVASGRPLATIRAEHEGFARSHHVWGVPTFVVGDQAVFVRLLDLADHDGPTAIATVERVLDQIDWPILNEFKHTSVPR